MFKIILFFLIASFKVCGADDGHEVLFAKINFEDEILLFSKYETTVGLWNEVAAKSGIFSYDDFEKIDNLNINAPVANIEFREICRWLNLYSEINKRDSCFYVGDTVYRQKIMDSDTVNIITMRADKNGFRLPLEVEWEHAHKLAFPRDLYKSYDEFGVWNYDEYFQDYGWFQGNSNGLVRSVGQKKANAWGGFDLVGNVSEFCFDDYNRVNHESASVISKVVKGGSVILSSRRFSRESRSGVFGKSPYIGFRWVISDGEDQPVHLNPDVSEISAPKPTPTTKNFIRSPNSGRDESSASVPKKTNPIPYQSTADAEIGAPASPAPTTP